MSEKQNTPTTQGKKSNKWLVTGGAIFALAALGVAGVFVYQNYQLKEKVIPKKSTPVSFPIPTKVPSPTPTINPTANWLTFTNENICYTFKYPKEVTLKERKEENIIHLSLWGLTQKKDTEFYDGISLSFSLPFKIENSLKEHVDNKIGEEKQLEGMVKIIKPREEIIINGINGYTYTTQGLGIFQNIFLQSPNKTCTVGITNATNDPTNQGYQKTVDKILSTFKFVD